MEASTLIGLLVAAALGSYVQAVTGFAMGMIILAVCGAGGLVAVPELTAVVSLLSLVNILFALKGRGRHLARRQFAAMAVGVLPAVAVGVWLLEHVDARAQWLAQALLGTFIVAGSLAMLVRPRPLADVSPPFAWLTAGVCGGLLGGMFSASGPVLGWFCYRQPLDVASIRTTLLATFALTTLFRTLVVGLAGGLTGIVWELFLVALPAVVLGTWVGRRLPPPVSEAALRRLAFMLLVVLGGWTVVRVLSA